MKKITTRPVGIFDSGVGGLTVASAIKQILPNENLIYFGDTAHLPYGDKSRETIISYAANITRFLIGQNCKVIVVACNTASANAYEAIKEEAGNQAVVVDVINPVVDYVTKRAEYKNIGIIGTKATINSETYDKKIKALNPLIVVSTLATPLFVPMIEEGFIYDDISNAIIRSYLSRHELRDIDALIMGCTHYPIIKNQISKYYNFKLDVIDSSAIVANYLRKLLGEKNQLNMESNPRYKFIVSDYTEYFQVISRLFFDEEIRLEKMDL
ncbi:MAG: glutamate racemase [Bacteroidales bacterium]|nr:glutamate racemase [Bacteroidales bacterium]